MKHSMTENKYGKRFLTAALALLIAFTAVFAIPRPAEAATLPKVTGVKAVSSTYKSIKITWKKASKVTGYKIYRATSANGKYKLVKTVSSAKTTSYMDSKGVKTGTKYYYKVRAYKKSGKTTKYGSYSKTVSAKAVPSKVNLKEVKNTANSEVTLNWKKVNGVTGYDVYRSTKSSSGFKKVTTINGANTVTFTNKGLKDSTTYYYKVRAFKTVKGKKVYGSYSVALEIETCREGWTVDANGNNVREGVDDNEGDSDATEDPTPSIWG